MPNNPPGNPARAREPPERRKTDLSHITFDSIRRRRTTDAVKIQEKLEKGPFQEHYACYEGLTWEALRGYLEGKWPGIRLAERKELDQWLFEIPERLTPQDLNHIAALRDSNRAQRRRAVTPE